MTTMLIACDLDGTLTFRARRPAPVVVAALRAAHRHPGVRLVIATARSPRCVRAWFPELTGLTGLTMVCCNGALTIGGRRLMGRTAIPTADLTTFLRRVDHSGAAYCLEYGERSAVSRVGGLPWMDHPGRVVLGDTAGTTDHRNVLKCTVEDPWVARHAARGLPRLAVVTHGTGEADVMAVGVSKGAALAGLRRPGETLVAFGNDRNDLEMLIAADRAVVVGGGLPELSDREHLTRVSPDPGAVAESLHATLDAVTRRGPRSTPHRIRTVGSPLDRHLSKPQLQGAGQRLRPACR